MASTSSSAPKWGAVSDAAHHLELTPFRHKDGLAAPTGSEELQHNTRDREYGLGAPGAGAGGGGSKRRSGQVMHYLHHKGGWLLATAHIVTAIIGAGVLGLPYALSWLGWVGGILVLLLFYAITLWSSLMLAACQEHDGMRHPTYRSAVLHILGPGNAAVLTLFQYLNLVLSAIGYTVAAGQSMRILVGAVCSRSRFDACYNDVWQMAIGFGAAQLFLSQMPNLEAAWWSSVIGALMSLLYSTCALGLGASQAHNRLGSVSGRSAPAAEKAFNVFNALGSIAYAYNFTGVLMEIQDTLHEPPKALVNMKRAVHTGMGCSLVFYLAVSVLGYLALGDAVPGDILTGFAGPASVVTAANVMVLVHMLPAYQVFSQPVFHGLEAFWTDHVPCCARLPPLALRILSRSGFVAFTTTIAALLPGFNIVLGLGGALVFWPAAVYFPVRLYSRLHAPGRSMRAAMAGMNAVAAATSLLAVVGSAWNIQQNVGRFTFAGGGE